MHACMIMEEGVQVSCFLPCTEIPYAFGDMVFRLSIRP